MYYVKTWLFSGQRLNSRCLSDAENAELCGTVGSLDSGAGIDDYEDGITAVKLGGNGKEATVADLVAERRMTTNRLSQMRRPVNHICVSYYQRICVGSNYTNLFHRPIYRLTHCLTTSTTLSVYRLHLNVSHVTCLLSLLVRKKLSNAEKSALTIQFRCSRLNDHSKIISFIN